MPKRSGLDGELIREIKRMHNEGRTIEELSMGLDISESEIKVALAGGIWPREEGDSND